jgi:hypothetical protein
MSKANPTDIPGALVAHNDSKEAIDASLFPLIVDKLYEAWTARSQTCDFFHPLLQDQGVYLYVTGRLKAASLAVHPLTDGIRISCNTPQNEDPRKR